MELADLGRRESFVEALQDIEDAGLFAEEVEGLFDALRGVRTD